MVDPVFEEEQQHLSEAYAKLQEIERTLAAQLERSLAEALADKENMLDDLAMDFGNGVNLETYVEFEAMHQVIDAYNQTNDIREVELKKAQLLQHRPYFAKVTLQFKPGQPPRDVYIGAVGMTDEKQRHFIIDWRSPVAEVYYNQENGHTSYEANGRTIEVDLKLRRQFDIERDTLNSYFDTTVAIQDPLLLKSLRRERGGKLKDITTTIQREQNTVIRHEDVPALLVAGIAGSGKTSVLLQRIAYLFYRQRDNLKPSDVYLMTPNEVFARYIDNVLPDMGESNPVTLTWDAFVGKLGLGDRGLGKDSSGALLRAIDERIAAGIAFDNRDFADIRIDDERVITAGQVRGVVQRFAKRIPAGPRLAALVEEELEEKIYQRARRLAADEEVQEMVLELDTDETYRIFGGPIHPETEKDFRDLALQYLEDRYQAALEAVRDGRWLRIDRIGMRLLGKETLSSAEYLYLKMALTGAGNRHARYVMVDEVQDYTPAQLMVLARYFKNAHFLLLGDPNQAIKPGTASFDDIRAVFAALRGGVSECQLNTSYRSSPEITALFASLMDPDARMEANSVQREGTAPVVAAYDDAAAYEQALRQAVAGAAADGGLCAVVAANRDQVKALAPLLEDAGAQIVGKGSALPASGVVLLDLPLAKGLEFDQVIVADAQASLYGDDAISRHRLYTAISRATQKVTVLACGRLTPLL